MTDKEAIEVLERITRTSFNSDLRKTRIRLEAIETVIKALEQKDKEISELKAKYDKDTHTLQNQLDVANADRVEKDKIIDLMERFIADVDTDENICKHQVAEFCEGTDGVSLDICVKCINQYFEKKVEGRI